MKNGLSRMHKILFLVIVVLALLLAAVLMYKGVQLYQQRQRHKAWKERKVEVLTEVETVESRIQELSGDAQALQAFLTENIMVEEIRPEDAVSEVMSDAIVIEAPASVETEDVTEQPAPGESESAIAQQEADGTEAAPFQPGDAIIIEAPEEAPPKPPVDMAETISQNRIPEQPEKTVSENGIPKDVEESVSGNDASVSGNNTGISGDDAVSGNSVSGNSISGSAVVDGEEILYQSSFVRTAQMNGEDKEVIARNTFDFSDKKIACLGDSLTAGDNDMYSYPAILKELLHAEEVYNLGIGGSSYGRYWDQAFVDRYQEIPADTDIILVMGGTNDGFAASMDELGSLEEKKPETYYGDIDELMRGLKKDYPNAKIIFATPPSNVLHDYLRRQRDYLLPQNVYADAVMQLAAQHGIDVIDLYHSNLLDTHDAQVISTYMPDGVHGNADGYQILAEHFASQIIQIMEKDAAAGTVSGNSSVSSNSSVSGDGSQTEANTEPEPKDGTNPGEAIIIQ